MHEAVLDAVLREKGAVLLAVIGITRTSGLFIASYPNVKIVNSLFEHLQDFDCMVSAANSHGLMDGGVDLAIVQFFGFELMDSMQERILNDYLGEQPVGVSFIQNSVPLFVVAIYLLSPACTACYCQGNETECCISKMASP
jgi:O-acetyl-ADP-ribose deacetylase (regulator of RNase III)